MNCVRLQNKSAWHILIKCSTQVIMPANISVTVGERKKAFLFHNTTEGESSFLDRQGYDLNPNVFPLLPCLWHACQGPFSGLNMCQVIKYIFGENASKPALHIRQTFFLLLPQIPSNCDVIYKLTPALSWDFNVNWNCWSTRSQQPAYSAAVIGLPFISWEQVGECHRHAWLTLSYTCFYLGTRTGEHVLHFSLIKSGVKAGRWLVRLRKLSSLFHHVEGAPVI